MNRLLTPAAFLVGLAALAWVGAGYLGSNLLALAMTLLIAAFYLMGALELRRFRADTNGLATALSVPAPLPAFGDWLASVPASLRNPVRLRLEGERVGLPGPALTPYLVGLLVILGMLGTFLGMVVTLKGAVLALESSTDLAAVRGALAAPIQGLGLAFGTSIAGVAASAMLGLMSALSRRERLQAGQAIDTRIAGDLRPWTRAEREAGDRESTRQALQVPAQVMPEMLDRLQSLAATLERQGESRDARLLAQQQDFHREAQAAYVELAASVGRSLQASLADSARIAGATLQPVVETTMAGIARETTALHGQVAATVQAHLDGVATRLSGSLATVTEGWTTALARQQQAHEALDAGLQRTLAQFNADFDRQASGLVGTVDAAHARWQAEFAGTLAETARGTAALHAELTDRARQQVDEIGARLQGAVDTVSSTWGDALAHHRDTTRQLTEATRLSLGQAAEGHDRRAAALLASVDAAHGTLRTELAARDEARLATWTTALAQSAATLRDEWQQSTATLRDEWQQSAATLRDEWQQVGLRAQDQQAQVVRTVAETAAAIGSQAAEQSRATVAEITQLMQAAAQAPRAAAEVIEALQQQVSAGLARDTEVLAERSRIMTTLASLLDAVNLAATEQRGAIDALVGTASDLLERAGERHAAQVESQAGRLADTSAQLTASAVEVASMGEAFGAAVQQFGTANEGLVAQLQRIEGALAQSSARSDEQLAYYVAQAREIIDLSLSSQKQIVDDLQRLANREAQPA